MQVMDENKKVREGDYVTQKSSAKHQVRWRPVPCLTLSYIDIIVHLDIPVAF